MPTVSSIQLPRSGMIQHEWIFFSPAPSLHAEVDTGRTVQLAHDHALGTVDDELAATDHDRDLAQVHLFLDRLRLLEPHPDLERVRRR